MRRVTITLFLFTLLSSCNYCYGQDIANTSVSIIDGSIYDFGIINEIDGVVSHVFKIKNTGSSALIIYQVSSSCGCTTPRYDSSPVVVGATRDIIVTFNPINQPRRIDKTILIRSNVDDGVITLRIKASVVSAPRTIKDDYPLELTGGIRLENIGFWLEAQPRDKEVTHILNVINNSKNNVNINLNCTDVPDWARIHFSDTLLHPNQKSTLVLTINPVGRFFWGKKSFSIPVKVDNILQSVSISVDVIFVENFSSLRGDDFNIAPKLFTNSTFHYFSSLKRGSLATHIYILENRGKSPLEIRHIEHSENIEILSSPRTILEGTKQTLTLKFNTDSYGTFTEFIRLVTNAPSRPVVTLKLMATVVK